jgi:5-(aminomethyl)-3-furanmethanol phosphate kinase
MTRGEPSSGFPLDHAWVVKLGGSLGASPALLEWLVEIAQVEAGRILVVPGGGIYADAVREQQRKLQFNDSTAHGMALHAMDQYGLQLAEMGNGAGARHFIGAYDLNDFVDATVAGLVPVWLPSRWVDPQESIPRTWDMTSDSLALWLAKQVNAAGVLLVKSVEPGQGDLGVAAAIRAGWVDTMFEQYMRGLSCPVWLTSARSSRDLVVILQGECGHSRRIIPCMNGNRASS